MAPLLAQKLDTLISAPDSVLWLLKQKSPESCSFPRGMNLPAASYGVSTSLFGTLTRGKPRGIEPRDRLKTQKARSGHLVGFKQLLS